MDNRVPHYYELMNPLLSALKTLGGSGSNDEILNQVTTDLSISDEIADILHGGRQNMSRTALGIDAHKTV